MNEQNLQKMRHSLSHIMAQAVLKFFPDAKLAIGPAIDDGFYYDFDLDGQSFSTDDLKKIEKQMQDIVKQKQVFEKFELTIADAREKLKNNLYKLELLEELEQKGETKVNFYRNVDKNGEVMFEDMCSGPHLENTGEVGFFKLDKVAGAYWRGDEKKQMLQRIYGLAFATKEDLKEFVALREEAIKRDHRKLGKEQGLFVFSELVGPGMPLYTPKGNILRQLIIGYSDELNQKIGYGKVHTPNMNKAELFKVSGHYDKYKEDMLRVVSNYTDEEYYLKPMNCPQHTQLYAAELRSYKDLPIRYCDFANLYRDEKPGELSGLTRLRCFAQDDGHSFCREDQIEQEFLSVLNVINEALDTYGMKYYVRLSLRDPEKKQGYIGSDEVWEKSQKVLEELLKKQKIDYVVGLGEAAFYGPKMDIMVQDALKREWQISTIQLDLNMPTRFGLKYIDADGMEKTPVMIHRAIIGSPDRFLGILIEHYAGNFPVWLSPVQVKLVAVGEKHIEHCQKIATQLKEYDIRVEVDSSNETVGYKIRKAEKEKVPYMIVIGDQEVENNELTVRLKGEADQVKFTLEKLVDEITQKIQHRK